MNRKWTYALWMIFITIYVTTSIGLPKIVSANQTHDVFFSMISNENVDQTITPTPPTPTSPQTPTTTPTVTPTSTSTPTQADTLNQGIVSITFDDGTFDHYTTAYPILESFGLNATFYIVSSWVGGGSSMMSSSQIRELVAAGNEIGSHTMSHPHLPTLNQSDLTYELGQSQIDLQQMLGIPVLNFASPFGEFDQTTVNTTKLFYSSNRSVNSGCNVRGRVDRYNILIKNVYRNTNTTTVESWIDQAIVQECWLVLLYHDIVNGGDSGSTTPSDFTSEMRYLQSSGVSVQTMNSALAEMIR